MEVGQIQLPVWSLDGRFVAFSVVKASKRSIGNGSTSRRGVGGAPETPIESARILVYWENGTLKVICGGGVGLVGAREDLPP